MITLQQAEIGYGSVPLFSPLSGHFATGSLTAVVGVNGAGKSTLLKTLAGLQPLQGGSLHFSGNQPPRMAYLPQQTELDRQFPIRVSDLVAMGNWAKSGMFGGLSKCASRHIAEALECVGMTAMASRPVGELSGGQLQRVLFARLLVQQAPLILLDEPFTGIDSATTQLLVQVIEQLHRQGRTLIAVLHDMSLVTNHFPQVLLLTPQCCHWGDADRVLEHIPALNVASQPQCQMAVVS
ncbi:metal ABC transporter ATP-binding protein [Serratia symbiotica]|uniref:ABC transporter ATP-binding protein n=2 Tax=Serratia symbiotica TaxID=138074 RepID=A0A068ZCN5_9GAMM|nr:ABC transporter ATP-binding protein [Serratia symbiotica]MBF1994842.1 ABC transporter ATP-binding protein [Serratia symbiotica]MBQ0954476.1 ABC transporter ATP-binding protein [Serratia symbiotica]NIH11813.1 ABC transporter ATP-binding protein [Serratia symbiotica]QLH64391.1 ABC transporter ATP-binding protein [Serratia symbiotica]QTP15921.1 ABC transporter ATP-binding protein [Serratia symbiotica]